MANNTDQIRALAADSGQETSLLDILDHVLNAGVVVHGSLVISLAGVDLVYIGLNVVMTSVETAMRQLHAQKGIARPFAPQIRRR